MEQHKNDEIDLVFVFSKFKEALKGWVKSLFKIIDYVLKNWIIITILIVLGVVLGFFSQANYKPKQKATVLLRVNFDAVDYVYSELDLINDKVKEKDSVFFSKMGLKGDSIEIKKIEATPIINLNDILEDYEENDRKLEGLLKNLEFDDNNLKIHETFNSSYNYHKLEFTLSENASQETLNKTIEYINSNEVLEELKVEVIKDIKEQIKNNLVSIKQIDEVINDYQSDKPLSSTSEQLVVVDKNYSLHALFDRKMQLQEINEDFYKLLVYSKDIAIVVNKPSILKVKEGLSGNKMLYYPVLLVLLFLLLSFIRYAFYYLKEIAES